MTRKRPERRGDLSGLLGSAQQLTRPQAGDVLRLDIAQVRPYAQQPRRSLTPADLETLTESVRQQGILQPLLVRAAVGGGYEIAAGERRYRAALAAGLSEVPALVREFSDEQMLEVGLVENLQRENLSVIDEVEGKLRLIALRLEVTPAEARQRLMSNLRQPEPDDLQTFEGVFAMTGKESWQSFTKNKLRVLQWPPEVLDAMRAGLPYSVAAVVAAAPDDQRPELLEQAQTGATIKELRAWLAAQKPQGRASRLEQDAQKISRTLGRSKWVKGLAREQQAELQKWLRTMPAWLRQQG